MTNPSYTGPSVAWRWWARLTTPTQTLTLTHHETDDGVGLQDGSLEWQTGRALPDSGRLTLVMPAEVLRTIPWLRSTITVGLDVVAPAEISHHLGVYLPTAADIQMDGSRAVCQVALYSRLSLIEQDKTTSTTTYPTGTVITDAATALLAAVPMVAITPSPLTLSGSRSWPAGTSLLQVINDLLAAASYAPLRADEHGWLRGDPQVAPGDQAPAHTYIDDEHGLYTADWTLSEDTWSIPNRLIGLARTSGSSIPIRRVVEDVTSPVGYDARGRWVTDTYETDATTGARLEAATRVELGRRQVSATTLTLTSGFLPIREGDVVDFAHTASGTTARLLIETRRLTVGSGLMNLTLRRVVT